MFTKFFFALKRNGGLEIGFILCAVFAVLVRLISLLSAHPGWTFIWHSLLLSV